MACIVGLSEIEKTFPALYLASTPDFFSTASKDGDDASIITPKRPTTQHASRALPSVEVDFHVTHHKQADEMKPMASSKRPSAVVASKPSNANR
jgi:hypothetical protein